MAKQSRSIPVMRAVVDEVAHRLWVVDESVIRIPDICEATGVNYGSVYHHFGSRENVIDAAYDQMFSELVQRDIDDLALASRESLDMEEYLERVRPLIAMLSAGPDRQRGRAMRTRIVAAALTRPGLARLIGATESRLTAELSLVITVGQDRGFLRKDVSAGSLAVLLQAIVFGRILDDVTDSPIEQGDWDYTIATLFMSLVNRAETLGG